MKSSRAVEVNFPVRTLLLVCASAVLWPAKGANSQAAPRVDDGTVRIEAFTLPESSLLSDETRAALKAARSTASSAPKEPCPSLVDAEPSKAPAIRACKAKNFYESKYYKAIRDRYSVTIDVQRIAGVNTEVFLPAAGIAQKNRDRVLINLHGGGFTDGARWASHIESIPIAALGKIKVISVDYRQAPEYAFPAASQDVAAVYRELIKTYKPQAIGIYGCSAGGALTAQSIAWFDKEGLPQPGAAGMFCAAANAWFGGDSAYFPINTAGMEKKNPYFKNVDWSDPLVLPIRSTRLMSRFPPSLLISSTRDLAMSSVVRTHSVLVARGVPAELHIWEGLGHAFLYDPSLPDSREAYDVIIKFFDSHLTQ